MKIYSKIENRILRYSNKNTLSAKLKRYRTGANLSLLATTIQTARLPYWQIADVGITSFLGTLTIRNFKETFKLMREIGPLKQRAASIKKAAHLSK